MELEQFYSVCNGDYADVKGRLMTEERVVKFVRLFMDDPTYDSLILNMETQNLPEAFRAAHTLKGLAANLSFTELYHAADELTESLRIGEDGQPANPAAAPELLVKVKEAYENIVAASPLISED